ncbi:dopa 4,5-dioxygenase [Metarhizium robertsii ARSEF 23]|uniref:Dopa 4,5-dioxygenase n=2 Tax=Metarhizium robertsii TaxID=568076 RepID=E9EXN9_METRA|nr:dopa 4,5-dioxygenase [Metarhizium robertsii ARSEF 23]EFY99859.1 dopa 4,5-dioxygenase [Metarhizium robertsii ARSEF 23]
MPALSISTPSRRHARLALSISCSCSIARAPEQRNDKTDTLPKMPNPWDYTYASPLAGFEDAPPLPTDTNDDGKSLVNPPRDGLSEAYRSFAWPLKTDRRGGFDIHVYYLQQNPEQAKYARELWERIRREFPELRVYKFWDVPVGPHPVAMFEVNVFTPAQFGAFVAWLAIWRGPLSALIHPNTTVHQGEAANEVELRDHTERAIWMGERLPLDWAPFRPQSHE